MSRTWTTWDCSEPCPVWPSSGFSVQRGRGKPFQREEGILPCCQTLGCHGWGLHPARVEQNLIWSTNGVENHSQSWKKEETKWILATRKKTCIYSYFFPEMAGKVRLRLQFHISAWAEPPHSLSLQHCGLGLPGPFSEPGPWAARAEMSPYDSLGNTGPCAAPRGGTGEWAWGSVALAGVWCTARYWHSSCAFCNHGRCQRLHKLS